MAPADSPSSLSSLTHLVPRTITYICEGRHIVQVAGLDKSVRLQGPCHCDSGTVQTLLALIIVNLIYLMTGLPPQYRHFCGCRRDRTVLMLWRVTCIAMPLAEHSDCSDAAKGAFHEAVTVYLPAGRWPFKLFC